MAFLCQPDMRSYAQPTLGIMRGVGQWRIWHGLLSAGKINQQRSQRVVMRRGGYLDLPRFGQLAIARNDAGNQFADEIEQLLAVFIAESLGLAHQLRHQGMFTAHALAAPDQVIPGQQVGHILAGQIGQCNLPFRLQAVEQFQQALVCRIGCDHPGVIAAEARIDSQLTLFRL